MLTKNQFAVMNTLRANGDVTSQQQLARLAGVSVGTANSALKELRDRRWVEPKSFDVTDSGLRQLEPYRVKNAVIMAAGFSSHFAPVSYERPKGLLTVRGEVLIERQIRQLREAGIEDITVVVGYMKELFFYLGDKFGVSIVVNDEYDTRDNNGSVYLVRDKLSNTYICSSDNYFTENVFEPYVYEAYYAGVYSTGYTEEWCIQVKSHDVICDVQIGGEDSWYMLGHVYFDEAFSRGFREILEAEYDLPATRRKLWEAIYVDHIDELRMVLRRYPDGVIYEFDSIEDMQAFDPEFIDNVDSHIMDNIAEVLDCRRSEVCDIKPIKTGYNNLSCKFRVGDGRYVYRHPGPGAKRVVSHASETFAEEVAKRLGIDRTFIFEDAVEGWKISSYVEGCEPFDYHRPEHVSMAMDALRRLHRCKESSEWPCAIEKTAEIVGLLDELSRSSFPDFRHLHAAARELRALVASDGVEPCLCHGNFYDSSFLVSPEGMDVIDWEYAGMGDYAGDLGTFICCCQDYSFEDAVAVMKEYFQREPSPEELRHCVAYVSLSAFHWFVWSMYMDTCGKPTGELLYKSYRYAKEYGQRALDMYR